MNRATQSAEPLTHLVEEYLSYLYEMYPTDAAFDGSHTNDDLLENPSAGALEAQGRELGGFRRRFEAIGSEGLTSVERLERRMLEDNVRGRIFEQEELQSWKSVSMIWNQDDSPQNLNQRQFQKHSIRNTNAQN